MAKHYMPAFEKGMAEGRKEIEKIANDKSKPTFENTIATMDKVRTAADRCLCSLFLPDFGQYQ